MASVLDDIDPDMNAGINIDCQYIDENELYLYFTPNSLSKNLTILHVNCRSMPKNFSALTTIISNAKIKPTIIAITETWLKSYNEKLFPLEGYNFVCNSRPKKKGGGVAIYIDATYEASARPELDLMNAN